MKKLAVLLIVAMPFMAFSQRLDVKGMTVRESFKYKDSTITNIYSGVIPNIGKVGQMIGDSLGSNESGWTVSGDTVSTDKYAWLKNGYMYGIGYDSYLFIGNDAISVNSSGAYIEAYVNKAQVRSANGEVLIQSSSTTGGGLVNITASGNGSGDSYINLTADIIDLNADDYVEAGVIQASDVKVDGSISGLNNNNEIDFTGGSGNDINITNGGNGNIYLQPTDSVYINNKLNVGVLQVSTTITAPSLTTGWKEQTLTIDPETGIIHSLKVPHVFLYNDSSNVTDAITTDWTKFTPSTSPYFTFAGNANIDSLANDTIKLLYSGHYWFKGGLSVAGNSGQWIKARLYNVTKNKAIYGVNSTTMEGNGNHQGLNIDGYCTFCHANDKIILQVKCEIGQTVTIYDGNISIWGNHGY